jgi:prepilin-type N-terminal cleavage/methylation domain-containing protein
MIIRRGSRQGGFTFIELLVVITIIGVIFAAGIVSYAAITTRSRDVRRKSDLEAMRQSLEICRSLTGIYPDATYVYQGDAQSSILSCGTSGPTMINKTPSDPKPCVGASDGAYSYSKTSTTTYTLSAPCMEVDVTYLVTNP